MTPNFQVVGTRIYNQGDGIAFASTATNWKVTGLRIDGPNGTSGYVHDDCIQNDAMNNGVIDDSKFDGCMVFLSAIDQETPHRRPRQPGRGQELARLAAALPQQLQHGEVRLRPHGGFFKWASDPASEGVAPKLDVHDSTFRADDPALYGGNANGFLGLPPGTSCNNVTLINTQAWPAKDLASWKNQCTNLTLATTSTWNAKVGGLGRGAPVDVAAWPGPGARPPLSRQEDRLARALRDRLMALALNRAPSGSYPLPTVIPVTSEPFTPAMFRSRVRFRG